MFIKTLIVLILVSCTNSNDNISQDTQRIIGDWKPVSEVQYVDGTKKTNDFTCSEMTTYRFLDNGNYTFSLFYMNKDNTCIKNTEYNISGTWEHLNDDNYKLVTHYKNATTNEIETVVLSGSIMFSDDSTTMTIYPKVDSKAAYYTVSLTFSRI